jgi:hypothetical protein
MFGEELSKDAWPLPVAGLERDDDYRMHRWQNVSVMASAGEQHSRPGDIVGYLRHRYLDPSQLRRVITVDDDGAVNTKVLLIAHDFYHRLSRRNCPGF